MSEYNYILSLDIFDKHLLIYFVFLLSHPSNDPQ